MRQRESGTGSFKFTLAVEAFLLRGILYRSWLLWVIPYGGSSTGLLFVSPARWPQLCGLQRAPWNWFENYCVAPSCTGEGTGAWGREMTGRRSLT